MHVCGRARAHTHTQTHTHIKQELGEVDVLVGPTKSMPLHKTHL